MKFSEVVELWKVEVFDTPSRKLTLSRVVKRLRGRQLEHYLFWFRLGQYLHRKPRGFFNYRAMARRIHARLLRMHGIDIMMGAEIGANFHIGHRVGVVITDKARIGKNFLIRQNTTIGLQDTHKPGLIHIGDNVEMGANCCVISNDLRIGDGAVIGAMSFVNKDVPAGATFYTTHTPNIRLAPAVTAAESPAA